MTQEKRSLLAAVLSVVILLGWYYFFNPEKQVPPSVVSQTNPSNIVTPVIQSTPVVSITEKKGNVTSKPVTQENDLFKIDWSSTDAAPVGIFLKKFREKADKDSPFINLLPFEGEKALTLLCQNCSSNLPDSHYRLVSESNKEMVYEAEKGGVLVRKHYEWNPDQYLLSLRVTVSNHTSQEFRGRLGLGWKAKQFPPEPKGILSFLKSNTHQRALLYKAGNKIEHNGLKDGEIREVQGTIPWAGIGDRYFLISLISRQVSSNQILRLQKTAEWLEVSLFPEEVILPVQGTHQNLYSFYVGPKDRESLSVAGVGLEEAIDYGFFSLLAIPILKLMQVFYSVLKNWGLAVLLLTLCFKILLNPLTIKSMKQMKGMQKLQPKLAELKEKYKDDRQRLNMETMALFKSHSVNPMGGCLPMVLQMPIYIALYNVLYNAIELYHAPFFWVYRDLSAPDPYFVLPILLGVAMVLQQKLSPNPSADPTQKQMMMIMPVMFTAFMLFLPLGLVLYIFVNTVTSVLQQWMYQNDIRWRDLLKFSQVPAK